MDRADVGEQWMFDWKYFFRKESESGGRDLEKLFTSWYPLPPRSLGIIGLEENREKIYGAQ